MIIHLVLFSTSSKYGRDNYYSTSMYNLIESAKQFGIEQFHLYSPEMLDVDADTLKYMYDHPDPGFGYYMWKPIIIMDVLSKIKEGDVVIYHDAGRPEYNYRFKEDINILVEDVITNFEGIGLGVGGWLNNAYTKDKCFKLMGCDTDIIRSSPQAVATWGIFQKNKKVLEFVQEWKNWCLNREVISTGENETNHAGYIRHTWDQSILTNLFYLKNIKALPYQKVGWEKDINTFIKVRKGNSFIKSTHTTNTKDGANIILDVFYKNSKLQVFTSGGVENILLLNGETYITPTNKVNDPHKNVYLYSFDVEYKKHIELKVLNYNNSFEDHSVSFSVEENYYKTFSDEHIITVICNGFHNSISSICTFVRYHINLGVDRIILHYREGDNINKLSTSLSEYIELGKVIIVDWNGKVPFFQDIRKDGHQVGLGEVAHMNHTLNVYKESKYITWLNIDQLLVIPSKFKNLSEYLEYLVKELNASNAGGFILKLVDFKEDTETENYYDTDKQINNISPYPQLIYFTRNIEAISSHCITLGASPVDIDPERICVNHYPFLDNNRSFNQEVVKLNNNLNKTLFL